MSRSDDVAAEIRRMPKTEILLGAGAAAVLLGFICLNAWSLLFKFSYSWFPTLALLGSVAAVALVVLRVLRVELMPPKIRGWLLVGVSVLPALGYVIDQLGNFWAALMLAGAFVMAYGAATSTVATELTHRVTERPTHEEPVAEPPAE